MAQLSRAVSSPLTESISPLLWSTSTSPNMMRSNPIAIRRNDSDDDVHHSSSDDEDEDGVVHSFQQLVLEEQGDEGEFCVGSLPTTNRRRARLHHQQQKQFGTSLPAAPMLRSTRNRMTSLIPPMSLTEKRQESTSPSYGSLRDSQLAKRFLDGPSSYREKGSNEIKQWGRLPFSQQRASPGERMQQQMNTEEGKSPSSLSALLGTNATTESSGPTSSFVDTEYSLQQQHDVLSTSLTGLELLQRGLSAAAGGGGADDVPPDASHLSSWSSSGNNTYDNAVSEQEDSTLDIQNHMSPLPDDDEEEEDDEEDDESPMFDLDME